MLGRPPDYQSPHHRDDRGCRVPMGNNLMGQGLRYTLLRKTGKRGVFWPNSSHLRARERRTVMQTLTRMEIQAIEEARGVLVNALRTAFGYSLDQAAAAVDQAARKITALLKSGLRLPHLHVHVMLYMSSLAHESLISCL
jgi:hypothetical protein